MHIQSVRRNLTFSVVIPIVLIDGVKGKDVPRRGEKLWRWQCCTESGKPL